jgi:hypothetical protein
MSWVLLGAIDDSPAILSRVVAFVKESEIEASQLIAKEKRLRSLGPEASLFVIYLSGLIVAYDRIPAGWCAQCEPGIGIDFRIDVAHVAVHEADVHAAEMAS